MLWMIQGNYCSFKYPDISQWMETFCIPTTFPYHNLTLYLCFQMCEFMSVVSAGEWRSCAHNASFRGGGGHQSRRRWDQNAGGGSWDRRLLQKLWCPSNWESSHRYKRNKLTRYSVFFHVQSGFLFISPLTVSVVLLMKNNFVHFVKHFTSCYAHTLT